jgi:hypothetical protein
LSSGTVDASSWSAGVAWQGEISMSSYNLISGTEYALVLVAYLAVPNYVQWNTDTGNSYPGYCWRSSDGGSTWSANTNDFGFEVYSLDSISTLQVSYESAEDFGRGVIGTEYVAQTFTTGNEFTITSLKIPINIVGSPTDLYANIYAVDGSNKPTGSSLSNGSVDVSSVVGVETIEITLTNVLLSAYTKYAIVLSLIGGGTVGWQSDNLSGYADGEGFISFDSGSTWEDTVDESSFEVWGYGERIKINIGDVWKDASSLQINIGDSWKSVTKVEVNIGDSWKTVYSE